MSNVKRGLPAALSCVCALALSAPAAVQAKGYAVANFFASGGGAPAGIAIDQASGEAYVANLAGPGKPLVSGTGLIAKFDAQGVPGTPATLDPEGDGFLLGTAVDPGDGHVDAFYLDNSFSPKLTRFDPATGAVDAGFPFAAGGSAFVQIATDTAGDVYVPNPGADVVEEYSSAGAPLNTFDCSACPGAVNLGRPGGVAVDASSNTLYIADSANNRVLRMATNDPTGASATAVYEGAVAAVAVDPADGHLFVGGNDGLGFHVTEHEPSGAEIADFGRGELTDALSADQIAVNATTGDVYVTDTDGRASNVVLVYVPVPAPAATTGSASAVNQSRATLNATVDPHGAETTYCRFAYGLSTSYSNRIPCSPEPGEADSAVAVFASAVALAPNTTYHFRVVEKTAGGEAVGADQTFTTPPNTPLVVSGGGTAQTATPSPSPAPGPPASGPAPTCKTDAALCPKPRSKPFKCKRGTIQRKVRGKTTCVKNRKKQPARKRSRKRRRR